MDVLIKVFQVSKSYHSGLVSKDQRYNDGDIAYNKKRGWQNINFNHETKYGWTVLTSKRTLRKLKKKQKKK